MALDEAALDEACIAAYYHENGTGGETWDREPESVKGYWRKSVGAAITAYEAATRPAEGLAQGLMAWADGLEMDWAGTNARELAALLRQAAALLPPEKARNDVRYVLSALRSLEEAVGEAFDDEGGIVAQIERDYSAPLAAAPVTP